MFELESSLHLYQSPLYRGRKGHWTTSFPEAVADCQGTLTWDPAAILGILGFTYTCGDRTLVNEVKRLGWLSGIGPDGEPRLEEIPAHGRRWQSPAEIAEELNRLLRQEALEVCRERQEIYVLLSGGLDSRMVAGVLAGLQKEGALPVKPIGVTWGLEDSRDVVYGRRIADMLGFEWLHASLTSDDLKENTEQTVLNIASLVSPVHLHSMHWFRNVSPDALVLAASYGDSVGRAEFSGKHVLELDYLRPVNSFGLLKKEVDAYAYQGVKDDLKQLQDRTAGQPAYVLCEHEMQGHYMRNMISQAMSVINRYCRVYQMFTHPAIYSYMWSIHPARRDDNVYAELLELLDPRLARTPWARTNRALRGATVDTQRGLRKGYHEYEAWIEGPLFEELNRYINPDWFAETGIFDPDNVRRLSEEVRNGRQGKGLYAFKPYEIYLWLAAFRRLAEQLEKMGKSAHLDQVTLSCPGSAPVDVPGIQKVGFLQRQLSRSAFCYNLAKQVLAPLRKMRKKNARKKLRQQTIRNYSPEIFVKK